MSEAMKLVEKWRNKADDSTIQTLGGIDRPELRRCAAQLEAALKADAAAFSKMGLDSFVRAHTVVNYLESKE